MRSNESEVELNIHKFGSGKVFQVDMRMADSVSQ